MLIKANGPIKSVMNKNVKIGKLNFRTKLMNKTNFYKSGIGSHIFGPRN